MNLRRPIDWDATALKKARNVLLRALSCRESSVWPLTMLILLSPFPLSLRAAAPPQYAITDLEMIPGYNVFPAAINNRGQIVGGYWASQYQYPAYTFLYQNGSFKTLGGFPAGWFGKATAINDRGQIAGIATTEGRNGVLLRQGFYYDNQTIALFGPAHHADPDWYPESFGLNDSGIIVGRMNTPLDDLYPFLYNTNDRTLEQMRSRIGSIPAINAAGHYLVNDVKIHSSFSVGVSPAFSRTDAYACDLNDRDQIVGELSIPNQYTAHAFLYDQGRMVDLGLIGEFNRSVALRLNNLGQVIGELEGASFDGRLDHPFLYTDGRMYDLNDLIPANSGWALSQVYDINDLGHIIGTGTLNGERHPFLLTPIPEPFTTLRLLEVGLPLLLARRLRNRTHGCSSGC